MVRLYRKDTKQNGLSNTGLSSRSEHVSSTTDIRFTALTVPAMAVAKQCLIASLSTVPHSVNIRELCSGSPGEIDDEAPAGLWLRRGRGPADKMLLCGCEQKRNSYVTCMPQNRTFRVERGTTPFATRSLLIQAPGMFGGLYMISQPKLPAYHRAYSDAYTSLCSVRKVILYIRRIPRR